MSKTQLTLDHPKKISFSYEFLPPSKKNNFLVWDDPTSFQKTTGFKKLLMGMGAKCRRIIFFPVEIISPHHLLILSSSPISIYLELFLSKINSFLSKCNNNVTCYTKNGCTKMLHFFYISYLNFTIM